MFKHASRRRAVVAPAILAMLASSFSLLLTTAPAQANPAGTGSGHQARSTEGVATAAPPSPHDFIELYNPTGGDIDVDGWSVQYRSSDGTGPATGVTPLSGTVPAGGHYLVAARPRGNGGTTALPDPDATGTIAMSGTARAPSILSNGTTRGRPGDQLGHPAPGDRRPGRASTATCGRAPTRLPSCRTRRRRRATAPAPTPTTTSPTSPPARRRRSTAPARGRAPRTTSASADRRDPGRRATASPHAGDIATIAGRRHRGLPDRRPRRLLPPDRRHRWRDRRHPGRLRRHLRLRAQPRRGHHDARGRRLGDGPSGLIAEFNGLTEITASNRPPRARSRHRRRRPRPGHAARHRIPAAADARGPRERAARPERRVHRHRRLHHQPVRRDRPRHRHPTAAPAHRRRRRRHAGGRGADRATTLTRGGHARRRRLASTSSAPPTTGRTCRSRCRGSRRAIRSGSAPTATLQDAVVMDYRNSIWKLQPQAAGHRRRQRRRDLHQHPPRERSRRSRWAAT